MKKTLIVLACIAYVLSPIDLIPDFIPLGGLLDDLVAIITAIAMCRGQSPAGPTTPGVGEGGVA